MNERTEDGIPAGQRAPRLVAVVPHTHWDREWYLPFQAFRLGLVEVLDEFLPRLESDAGYDRFLLDGQMAVVDDYLELRPEAAEVLRRLAEAGRLTVGPWYILMDEFLVSGETIIRNLQLGLERAYAFGGAMSVGYLPDMFGHVAQMPQLLRLAGFEHAVVWRGVPAAVDRSAFWWQAPDGSTVRAEYLLVGYGNGAAMPDDPAALVRRVEAHEAETARFALGADAPMLWMNGTDHQAPQPWLGEVLAAANAAQDHFQFTVSSLPEYLAKAPTEGLPSWRGELRSGARANLLMGVASNRVDVKIAAARAERALERVAEPLCALWLAPDKWPGAELRLAWENVIRNSAHDSICACSHDLVGTSVLHRYSEATTIAEVLRRRALQAAAAVMPVGGRSCSTRPPEPAAASSRWWWPARTPSPGARWSSRWRPGSWRSRESGPTWPTSSANWKRRASGRTKRGNWRWTQTKRRASPCPSSPRRPGTAPSPGHHSWPRRGPRRAPSPTGRFGSAPSGRAGNGWRCTSPTCPATAGRVGCGAADGGAGAR